MGKCKNNLYKWVSSGNAGYQVTFPKSSNIAPFDGIGPFQGDKKGNFVTTVFKIYLFVQRKVIKSASGNIPTGTVLSNIYNFQSNKGGEIITSGIM